MKLNKTVVDLENLAMRISPPLGLRFSRAAARWMHRRGADDAKRNLQADEIRAMLGPLEDGECARISRASIVHRHLNRLGNQLIERRGLDSVLPFVEWRNREILDAALAAGRGVILTTWHFGPYLSLTAALKELGQPMMKIVGTPHFETPPGWEIHVWNREVGEGVALMKRGLKWLREGRAVFIALDGGKDEEFSVRIPFMGRWALVQKAVGALWDMSGAPVIPLTAHWDEARLKIIASVHPAIEGPGDAAAGDERPAGERLTIRTAAVFADFILAHPEELSLNNFRRLMKFEKIAATIPAANG